MSAVPSDLPHDEDATTRLGIFMEAQERLKIGSELESDNRILGINALNFRNGEQWDADIANNRKIDHRPALTINHTNTFCQKLKNTLRQQRPRIKVHPTGGGARVEDANVIGSLIRHIEALSNASVAYDTGVESAVDIGWGYWRIKGDYVDNKSFDQELKIVPIRNSFTVYMDPASIMPAGEDQEWCLITQLMTRREYKRKYPKAKNVEWQADAPGDMTLDWENKENIRLAEYYRIHEVPDTLYMMNDGRTAFKSELPSEESMAASGWTFALNLRGEPISRPSTRREVQWFRINGREVIEERSSAEAKRTGDPARGPIPGRFIPVIRCEGNVLDVNGRVHRKGMIQDMMDPAKMFNYWRTAQTERYALAPKAPWVAAEGQLDGHPEWHDANQKSYSVLVYKPAAGPDGMTLLPPPQRQMPAQIEAGMTEAAAGAQADLMAVAGMPLENPEIQSRIVSGNKHLQRRQGMQDLVHFQYYDKQTLAIMWTGIVLLELIPYYYDTERMQRIIGEDGLPSVVKINPSDEGENTAIYRIKNNMEAGRYDVIMDTGPGYATKREEGSEAVLGLLGTPLAEPIVKTGADIVVRNMDFAGADELADRLVVSNPEGLEKVMEGLPKQAQTIVQSLLAEKQQMQQVIQQQALEIKYQGQIKAAELDAKTKIEAAKLEVAEGKSKRDDATKRYDTDVDSVTRRDVAEIGAAAQLLNSQQESKQEEKMADKLIERGVNK
jgi:hypothetical protein